MPLNPATLVNEILKISDASKSDFGGFPKDNTEVGQRWGAALKVFFDEMLFPPLVPGTTQLAADAFAGSLSAALGAPGAGVAALPVAYQTAGGVIAAGSAGAGNISIPPPAPPNIPTLPFVSDAKPVAAIIAAAVFAWAKTGLSSPPPNPPSIPWS